MKHILLSLCLLIISVATYAGDKSTDTKLDIFLFIGQSNMAGRGYITDNYKDSIDNVYLLTPTGDMEPASNPLNKYSTIRKDLKMQGVGPAYPFQKPLQRKPGIN